MDGMANIKRDEDGYIEAESYVDLLRMVRDSLPDGQTRDDLSFIVGALIFYQEAHMARYGDFL